MPRRLPRRRRSRHTRHGQAVAAAPTRPPPPLSSHAATHVIAEATLTVPDPIAVARALSRHSVRGRYTQMDHPPSRSPLPSDFVALIILHCLIPFSNSKISSKYGSGQKIWTPRISAGSSRIKKGQFPSRISSWECPHETFFWPGTNIFEFNRSLVWKILTTRSDCNFDLFCFLPKFWGSRVICPQL